MWLITHNKGVSLFLNVNLQDGLSDGLNGGGHPLSYGGPPGGGPGGGDTRGGQSGVPGTSGPEQAPVDLSQQAHRPNGILHPDTSKFFCFTFKHYTGSSIEIRQHNMLHSNFAAIFIVCSCE